MPMDGLLISIGRNASRYLKIGMHDAQKAKPPTLVH
jgi:hypothetical protein